MDREYTSPAAAGSGEGTKSRLKRSRGRTADTPHFTKWNRIGELEAAHPLQELTRHSDISFRLPYPGGCQASPHRENLIRRWATDLVLPPTEDSNPAAAAGCSEWYTSRPSRPAFFESNEQLPLNITSEREAYWMRNDGDTTSGPDHPDHLFGGPAVALNISRSVLSQISAKRIFGTARITFLDKYPREMRTAGQTLAARLHFAQRDIHSTILQRIRQHAISIAALLDLSIQPIAKFARWRLARWEIGEQMNVSRLLAVRQNQF